MERVLHDCLEIRIAKKHSEVDLSWVERSWVVLSWVERSWVELSWVELSWVDLSWVERGRTLMAQG